MKQHAQLRLLLIVINFAYRAFGQSYCDTFVQKNALTVSAETLKEIDALQIPFQDVVDCLSDDAIIRFTETSFSVAETIRVDKNISISSAAADDRTAFICNGQPIFAIRDAAVTISSVSIKNCTLNDSGAPIIVGPNAEVVLRSVKLLRNTNVNGPSAVNVMANSSLTIQDSKFRNNRGLLGTVVLSNATSLIVSGSEFVNNSATNSEKGGGVFLVQNANTSMTITVKGGTRFIKNEAVDNGGVFYVSGSKTSLVIKEDTLFKGNVAMRRGGAVYIIHAKKLTIENASFVDNEAKDFGGGAVFAEDSTEKGMKIDVSDSLFVRNQATGYTSCGGAIRIKGTSVRCSITDSVLFSLNTAEFDGGGMYVSDQATVIINGASFIANEALNGGGAALFIMSLLHTWGSAIDITVVNTVFLFNRALYSDRGGGTIGVAGFGSNITIRKCDFQENDGGKGAGGAIYVFHGPVVTIEESSFVKNKANRGGAIYAENDAFFDIENTRFDSNSADEGGALHLQGDIDIELKDNEFNKNRALLEGGAIKVRNYGRLGDDHARFRMTNNAIVDNGAGTNLFEDRLYGTETRGGGIFADGSGTILELKSNQFSGNNASNGGALNIYAVADCSIDLDNKFEDNNAMFGAGIFFTVDEQINPIQQDEYRVSKAAFWRNRVEIEGGAIYVSSARADSNSESLNAGIFRLLIDGCNFENNTARRGGGALSMIGAGVKIRLTEFESNHAIAESASQINPFLGYGGAVHVQVGSSTECKESKFLSNRADVGGAVFVSNGAFEGKELDFMSNTVLPSGVGGAVAVKVSKGRDIPILNNKSHRSIIFQCDVCQFEKNNGSLAGGALHVHDGDPGNLFSVDNELKIEGCEHEGRHEFSSSDNQLTCPTYWHYLDLINSRSVRFRNTSFTENTARAGGAIFTNNITMIKVLVDLEAGDVYENDTIGYILQKSEKRLARANVTFDKNTFTDQGYGERVASTPFKAFLTNLDAEDRHPQEEFANESFLSGARLQFDVEFKDGLDERVTVGEHLTAYICCDEQRSNETKSNCSDLEISGQETAQVNNRTGKMHFTAVRLSGRVDHTYTLRVEYQSTSELQTLSVVPSFIRVTMRPCKIGEKTVSPEGKNLECQKCGQGEFQPFPELDKCEPCVESNQHTVCDGRTIVPQDGYWHPTSFSFKTRACIGHEACKSVADGEPRVERLQEIARQKHEEGSFLVYHFNNNNTLCREGYRGVLCGSCEHDYGRENGLCRKCDSRALQAFLLLMLVLWSLLFLSYFIRSVLQLATRIEFNKSFKRARTLRKDNQIEMIPIQSAPVRQESSKSGLSAYIEIIDVSSTPSFLSLDWVLSEQSKLEKGEIQEETNQPMATASGVNGSYAERLASLKPSSSVPAEETSVKTKQEKRTRNRGRLVKKLRSVINSGTSGEDIEPLTLANPVSEILKILVNFVQVTSVAVSINVEWENSLRNTLIAMGAIGNLSSGSGYLSLDCHLTDNGPPKSLRRLTISILYPLFIIMFYVIFWACYTLIKGKKRHYFNQRALLSFLAIIYFFYTGMTKNLLRFFSCTWVTDDREDSNWSRHVWEEDTEVECFEGRHAWLVGVLVTPLLLAVSFGFPAGVLFNLCRNKDMLNDEEFVRTYGFLYRAYDKYYWEVIILLRKASIAVIAVFSYGLRPNLQGLMCVVVIVIALSFHLVLQPFTQEMPQLNRLETCSLSATIVVFVTGLMMNDEMLEPMGRVALSALAILFVCSVIVVILVQLVFATEEFIDMKLIELRVMSLEEVTEARLFKKVHTLMFHYWGIALTAGKALHVFVKNTLRAPNKSKTAKSVRFSSDTHGTPFHERH